jgi:hypothetical protein
MDEFNSTLEEIAAKPHLYVGQTSLRLISHYLAGYDHALMDLGRPRPLFGWMRWIEMKFMISHPAWHWTRILIHIYGNDRAALDVLPELFSEFSAYVAQHGAASIDVEHTRRFLETYGNRTHEPDHTQTTLET